MAIFIVRHAESEANINGRTLSHASIQLSENGLNQAKNLISKLPQIDKVIISKYLRTQQTAQPIIDHYNIPVEINDHLHEFSYLSEAKCANTTLEERKVWVDEYWNKMDVQYQDASDAESFAQFYGRVEKFAQKLKQLKTTYHDKNLLVVSHGQYIQLLMMYLNKEKTLSSDLMREFREELKNNPIKNAAIYQFSLDSIETLGEFKLIDEKSNS